MDRLIYTALNGMAHLRDRHVTAANNLANMSVPGFRQDLPAAGSPLYLDPQNGLTSRAFRVQEGPRAFSDAPGALEHTGEPMDIALVGEGYFFVQPPGGGEPALSRRGDLMVAADGTLTNGAGEAMLDSGLSPVQLPPFRSLTVDDLGRLIVEPQDGAPGERVVVATLATVQPPPGTDLRKSSDGRIRVAGDAPLPPPDQLARVTQGMREGSNVNPTAALIETIELQRAFEINLRLVMAAREADEAGAALMRMPQG